MIINFKKYKINESPDHIDDGKVTYYLGEIGTHPFFIKTNSDHTKVEKLYVGEQGDYHSDVYCDDRSDRAYPGRIWLKYKIFSFWVYPNEILFVDIIKHIEKHFNIKIFNNGWRIEVLMGTNEPIKTTVDRTEFYMGGSRSNQQIIPIEEYAGSDNVPEELQIQHLMNWKEKELAKKVGKLHFKGFGSDKTAWDSRHNIKYRQAIYQEKNLIKETPDTLRYTDKRGTKRSLYYHAAQAKPFFFTVNEDHTKVEKLFIGTYGSTHGDIPDGYMSDNEKYYAGRLWKRSKMLSFWVYPNEILFVDIIKHLEKKLKTKIFNNGWRIEVFRNFGEIRKRRVANTYNDFYFGSRYDSDNKGKVEIIPVEDYIGSENAPEEDRILHMMNWKEKEDAKKAGRLSTEFGSSKTAWDQPHNIKYRRTIYQEKKNN